VEAGGALVVAFSAAVPELEREGGEDRGRERRRSEETETRRRRLCREGDGAEVGTKNQTAADRR
jgi:hypothetical protein